MDVSVFDGVLSALVPAGEMPSAELIDKGWFPPRTRPSKYDRVTLNMRGHGYKPKYITFPINPQTKVFLYDLAE